MSEETKAEEGQEQESGPVVAEVHQLTELVQLKNMLQQVLSERQRKHREGDGLFVKTISVTYERKFNLATGQPLDNYESARLGFTCWADREEGADLEQDVTTLWELAKEQVKAQALPMLKARNEKRKELAESREAARPMRAQPARPPAPAVVISPTAPTQATPPPAPIQTTQPPPPAAGAPPPAPGQAAVVAINKVTAEDIDFMRITAPSGKAQVEFWRKGRTYPEVRWQRGGAMLLEAAPALAGAGFVAGHFDIESVGQEYQRKMLVSWMPSPKNPKWRDLTKIELVQTA